MGTHAGVIQLNGKPYDAKTGREMSRAIKSAPHSKPAKSSRPRSVDGFFKSSSPAHKPAAAKPHHQTTPTKVREGVKHTLHHKQQKSQTLMRHAVQKPQHIAAPDPEKSATADEPMLTHGHHKMKRAMSIPKSSLISKFADQRTSSIQKHEKPLPVRPEPAQHSLAKAAPPPVATKTETAAEKHFHQALSKADAHKQTKHHTSRRKKAAKRLGMSARALNSAAAGLAVLLLIGFFAYQNIPNISMRIASTRAGFSAKLPGYQPSGFALGGPIEYGPGQITVAYESNSDDRKFAISQQVSGWNSEALADNYLTSQGKTYQTYQDKGRTIYLYDGANATWVSGGVWYEVDGNDILSNDQLIRIANSL